MNYILQLNSVLEQFSKHSRLNPTQIILCIPLFQFWNINRFSYKFYFNREEIMQLAKIGSKATYQKSLINLNYWKYIVNLISKKPFKVSKIKFPVYGTTAKQDMDNCETSNEQALVSNTNNNKQKINLNKRGTPQNGLEIFSFFKTKNRSPSDGIKFYHHYQILGWKMRGWVWVFSRILIVAPNPLTRFLIRFSKVFILGPRDSFGYTPLSSKKSSMASRTSVWVRAMEREYRWNSSAV